MQTFSDYIVYVDESGDLGLTNVDTDFPVFCLAMCVFPTTGYTQTVVPAISDLKFRHWGHDGVILHENDMRQRKGDFKSVIQTKEDETRLFTEIHEIIKAAPFQIVATIINKPALIKTYSNPWSPYELALHLCLERLHDFMTNHGQSGRIVHIIFESRGKNEDLELELAFRRITAGRSTWGWKATDFGKMQYEPNFAAKKANIPGLQVADLVARPLALRAFRPEQKNRTYDVLGAKSYTIKTFP